MPGGRSKNLRTPDETIRFPGITEDIVDLGDLTVGRAVQQPGWRWSIDIRPTVGGEWCQARHVGVVLSGRAGILMIDGTTIELGPDDVYDIPPGHDGYTIGDEPCVMIEWSGLRAIAGHRVSFKSRALATLLMTDIVESTSTAARLGDAAWRELLSMHYESARAEFDRSGGREVATTGDGLLATFDGPATALRCAAAIRSRANEMGLHIRAGVHVGEVEQVAGNLHGIAVHEAARVMGEAGPDEILVSETTRALALTAGFAFEDRGQRELKGLPEARRLFAYVHEPASEPAP